MAETRMRARFRIAVTPSIDRVGRFSRGKT
jgi:hypothetical protein